MSIGTEHGNATAEVSSAGIEQDGIYVARFRFSRFDFSEARASFEASAPPSVARKGNSVADALITSSIVKPIVIMAVVFLLTSIFCGAFGIRFDTFGKWYLGIVAVIQGGMIALLLLGFTQVVQKANAAFLILVVFAGLALWWAFALSSMALWAALFLPGAPGPGLITDWLGIVVNLPMVDAQLSDAPVRLALWAVGYALFFNAIFSAIVLWVRTLTKDKVMGALNQVRKKTIGKGDNMFQNLFFLILGKMIDVFTSLA